MSKKRKLSFIKAAYGPVVYKAYRANLRKYAKEGRTTLTDNYLAFANALRPPQEPPSKPRIDFDFEPSMSIEKRQLGPCTLYLADCLDVLPALGGVDAHSTCM